MAERINIVLATDNNYAQHATVTMVSALCNSEFPNKLRFFVIDDNIGNENKQKMQLSVNNLGGQICFVKENNTVLDNVFVSGNLTRAAYFRLDIPNILPNYIDRVIYLDCDLLLLKDVYALWQIDLQGMPLAAAEDFGILASSSKCAEKIKNLAWNKKYSYFNSGVLIIDVKQWREKKFAKKLLELVATRNFRHHDQDALNFLFMNSWMKLPLQWNVIPTVFNMPLLTLFNSDLRHEALNALKAVSIIHYAGGYKPWEYEKHDGFNDKYYEYLSKTQYCNDTMPQPNPNKKGHSLNRQLWRLRWSEWIKKLLNK